MRGGMRRPLVGLLLAAAVVVPARIGFAPEAATASAATPGVPGYTATVTLPVQHAGEHRSYLLHVPDGLLGPAPLVVALHGAHQTAAHMAGYSRLTELADQEGFVLAYGMGLSGTWNAGTCCKPRANDVAYLDSLLAHATDPLRSRVVIDPDRVFLTGYSNGGMMALRYACSRADRVAAVAVVAATLVAPCEPGSRVAVLDVHGEVDTVVPVKGGRNDTFRVHFPAVRPALQPFRDRQSEVRVRVVAGTGHDWMSDDSVGYDASRAVWDWLRDHPRT